MGGSIFNKQLVEELLRFQDSLRMRKTYTVTRRNAEFHSTARMYLD
jgi:hypothetical protein